MSKYQKIMDRVVVTEKMRSRIIGNVEEALIEQKDAGAKLIPFRRYAAVAASVAVLLLGVYTAGHFAAIHNVPEDTADSTGMKPVVGTGEESSDQTDLSDTAVLGTPGTEEAASAEELSQKTGIAVWEITVLSEKASDIHYICYDDMAEIIYTVDGQEISFRKSVGSGDNSGDYNDYASVEAEKVRDVPVTVKGNDGSYHLAVWEQDGYSCSVYFSDGVTKEELTAIVEEAAFQ